MRGHSLTMIINAENGYGYSCNRNRFASSGSANRMAGKRLETDVYVNSEATYIRTDLIPILM